MSAWLQAACSSESACVQARCESNGCVDAVAIGDGTVALRSTLAPHDVLRITRDEWTVFLAGVKAGDFDTV